MNSLVVYECLYTKLKLKVLGPQGIRRWAPVSIRDEISRPTYVDSINLFSLFIFVA